MVVRKLFLILILLGVTSCAARIDYRLNLYGEAMEQGGVAVFDLTPSSGGQEISVAFAGGEAFVFESDKGAWGIVAAGLGTAPGSYDLAIEVGAERVSYAVEVVAHDYGTQRITVDKDKVELSAETLKRVAAEKALITAIWASGSPEPFWSAPFVMPLDGTVTGVFGTKRIFNGSPRNPHGGVDIAAPEGKEVGAANRGRVAFVGNFFFNGKFVVIDHGLGVFTMYAHLSGVNIALGELVERGAVIGAVGSTGRATGPHLHFSVKLGRLNVSPERLFEATERLMQRPPMEAHKGFTSG
jgi:murein DD-endopeptidase MepM/ murein hydrolase activator NlpD